MRVFLLISLSLMSAVMAQKTPLSTAVIGKLIPLDKTTYAATSIAGAEIVAKFIESGELKQPGKLAAVKRDYDILVLPKGTKIVPDYMDSGMVGFHFPKGKKGVDTQHEYFYRP